MSTFNFQKDNGRSKPTLDSFILGVPREPFVKLPQPVLYKEEPPLYHIPPPKDIMNPQGRKLFYSLNIPGSLVVHTLAPVLISIAFAAHESLLLVRCANTGFPSELTASQR